MTDIVKQGENDFGIRHDLPESISLFLKNAEIKLTKEGKSEADVYRCCDLKTGRNYYLKIEKWNNEVKKEHTLYQWLHKGGKLPVPVPVFSIKEGDTGYLLLEEAKGEILRTDKYYADPNRLARLAAEGIKMLVQTDISDCPADGQVEGKIKLAGEQLCPDSTDLDPSVPYTKDFSTHGELYEFLKENQPEENLVFTHGDCCLNNFFTDGEKITAFIDFGMGGVGDMYQDIALCVREFLKHCPEAISLFWKYLGIKKADENKLRYYMLLDELF